MNPGEGSNWPFAISYGLLPPTPTLQLQSLKKKKMLKMNSQTPQYQIKMNCNLAIASNHILVLSASKKTWAILINSKMKSREPTKRDRIRKKIIAMCKELQLYFQLKRDGGSSTPFSAICMFPTKSFALVNGRDDKEEKHDLPVT